MKGVKVFFPNQGFFYYPERSYCINRTLFDQECAENATKADATLLLNSKVVEISKTYSSWKLTTQNGEVLRSKYLIAADGATSTVRRLLGFREKFTTAIQYKFKPIKRFEEDYFIFYNNEMFPHGYAWIFNRGVETSIGVLGIGNIKKKLEEFIRSFNIKANQKKSVQYGAIPNSMRPMPTVLPGVLFSGDAGGFTFPLTKGGVIGALFSGREAGEVVRDALIEDNPEILSTYSDRIKPHPSRSRVALFYSHKFLLLNNNSLNAVGEIINKRLYSEIPVINAICYLSKKPNLETANGFLVGFAAQQVLGHFRKYVF